VVNYPGDGPCDVCRSSEYAVARRCGLLSEQAYNGDKKVSSSSVFAKRGGSEMLFSRQKKAIATYGPEWKALIDKHVSCELMKVPGKKSYWLCYCSAVACKQAVKPSDDPDLDWKPKKLNRDPGVSRIPHGSFGTRRASPPSFRTPRMGPTIR